MKFKTIPLSLIFLLFSYTNFAQNTNNSSLSENEMDPNASIISYTESAKNFKTLFAAICAADLEEILDFDGPFTVFAPSDLAFKKLSSDAIEDLLNPSNKKEIKELMTHHIIAGNFSASKILSEMCRGKGKASFTTVHGDELLATIDGTDIVLTDDYGNQAKITTADSNQCNGVIHEIDTVIRPKKL